MENDIVDFSPMQYQYLTIDIVVLLMNFKILFLTVKNNDFTLNLLCFSDMLVQA